MRRARTSLRRRLTGLCAMLTVATLVVTGFDSWQRERATLQQDTRDRLLTLAHMVALNTKSGIEFDGEDDVRTFLQTVTASAQVQAVAVYLHDGSRFAVAGDAALLPAHLGLPVDRLGDELAEAPLPYRDSAADERTGRVLVRASGEPARARLRAYVRGLLTTDLLALAALSCAAWWLLNRLLRPIAALVETTNEVRRTEDYTLRAERAEDDEVGTLVAAFNAMLDAIQSRDNHLAGNAERLEQQVRERTAELRAALAAAESSTRAKSTFVANMSHEIRTPLNAILGMTELALEAEDSRELREYLGVIRSAGSNLLGVLCDILDLSKIESEKLELSTVPTDLEALLMDALRPLTARMQSKNLELSATLDPALATAYRLDDVRTRQVLTNLVGNAIKFTESGFVSVDVRLEADRGTTHDVEFVVRDTGVGIPRDRLAAIFQPFTQADNTITRRFAGTGLGLHITERLVRLMGGSIRVDSEEGKGSTFVVRLPLDACASPLPEPAPLPAATRIVLLSRSPAQKRAVAAIAARLRLPLREVDDAHGLRSGDIAEHDVVLADERDPDLDPVLCEAVRLGDRGRRPLLLVTSFQDLATAASRCRDHAFAGYLTKPLSGRELATRLHALLGTATPGSTTAAAPAANVATLGPRPLRILVAEDNAVNQKLIQRILARDGHDVVIAENGRLCCDALAASRFDLVLMDMQMPVMSGLQATTEIRTGERQSGQRVPIVALTANTTVEDRRACLDAGMDEVLSKPISIPKLRATLARFGAGAAPSAVDPAADPKEQKP